MNDREKLVEFIEETGMVENKNRCNIIAEELIAHGVTVQRWIPVTERLPKPFEDVLVYDPQDNRVAQAYMTRPKEWVGIRVNHEVTRWMPLPEPPKEDAE